MAKKFLVDLDLLQNELQNGVFQHLATAPANPKEGQFYYNTAEKKFYVFEGEKWNCFDSATDMAEALAKKADKAYTGTIITGGSATELAPAVSEIATQVNTNTSAISTLNGDESTTGSVAKSIKDAIEGLDATKSQEAGADGLALTVVEEDGKITSISGSIAANTYDAYGAAAAVSGTWGTGVTAKTVKEVQDEVDAINNTETGILATAEKYTDDEIKKLDTAADIALATAADGVVTIKAVKEADGIIAASTDTTLDVTLAKVATTGKAEDVSVADTEGKITATTVEGALEEIVAKADANTTAIGVLNGDASTTGSVAKSIADKLGTITSTNYVAADATVNANVSTLDAKVKEIEDATTGTTVVVDADAGTATVTKGTTSFTTYVSTKEDTLLNGKADKATTLAGYGIEDAYTKTEIDAKVASTFHYKGSVDNYADLPTEGQQVGDVWNIKNADPTHGIKAGDNVAWNGTEWDVLGGTTDLSAYALKADVEAADAELAESIADAKDELHRAIVANKTVVTNPALTPAGGIVTWTITHNYGEDVEVAVKEAATGEEVVVTVLQTNNLVTIKFNASAAVAANTYRAVIMGVVPYTPESGE